MKRTIRQRLKNGNGITLIALVITIIVLLILAGVAISMLSGENGILNQAANAKEQTDDSTAREQLQLAILGSFGKNGMLDFDTLKREVESVGGTVSGTGFPVTISKGNITLQVEGTGNYTELGTTVQTEYILTKTDGTEIAKNETTSEDAINIKISISNMSDIKEVKSITLKKSDGTEITGTANLVAGTIECEITENGSYTLEIEATDSKGNKADKKETIEISGKIKIANMPDSWQPADSTNASNDWYAYEDANGNIASVNEPKLADGMTAIKYVAGTDTATYETLTAGSQWANAMTKDGSMWVWIPRFAYQIPTGYHKSGDDINPDDGTLGAGTINIAFLKDNTNEFLDSTITGTVVSGSEVTESIYTDSTKWILAPGFTFGDEPITGFWFAKFEASNTDGYGDSSSKANNTDLTLQIKPNVTSWRSITAANIFTVCQNLTSASNNTTYFNNVTNVDTHMTKNVEWGAVAYLAHSAYGLNGEEICINNNSSYITGIGSGSTNSASSSSTTDEYNTELGITASTTKNVYGIYDMSGGSWEYVAACLTGYTSKLTTNTDTSYINKYIDIYDAYSTGYTASKYGDAIYETSNTTAYNNSPYSWFKDYSGFVYSSGPVFERGGLYSSGSKAGLFCFNGYSGNAVFSVGFRPVCVVK